MHRNLRLAGAALAVLALPLSAQLGSYNPAPGARGVYAIRNAHIVPVSGPEIASGTIVIGVDGKITAVGANAAIPADAKIIDGTGLSVYPGMMEASSSIGLLEIEEGANATVDNSEVGRFNPNVGAFWGIDPHSAHIGVSRVVGITEVMSRPSGGLISGTAAIINLSGYTVPEMVVTQKSGMVFNLPSARGGGRGAGGFGAPAATAAATPGRMTATDSIKQMLRDAEVYGKTLDAYAKDKALPRPKTDLILASLLPVIRGEMPALFNASTSAEIKEAVAFAEEMKLKPIIIGGRDAPKITDYLKQHNVPVIFSATMELPSREDDPYDANYSAPAKLAAAGVRFAISSGEPNPDIRNLPYVAGMAASFGLSKEDALKAVTLWPAQITGVGDRFGSLEVGKVANLVVLNGDMLEARSDTKYLFIDGRPVPLETKHTQLNDLFKNRP
ncbi:MAG: amidohydrolase family protein [Gemmatimonadales bacterium]